MRRSPQPANGSACVALAVMFLAASGLPGLGQKPTPAPALRLMAMTELSAGSNGHFFTTADINGQDIQVLVDTGASAVALSYEDALAVGLKPHTLEFDVKVSTANGEGRAARVKLKHVMIDNVKVRDVDGLVLQEGAIKGTLLGMSYLGRLRSFSVSDGKLVLKN
jgi:aspartyl protease family protein